MRLPLFLIPVLVSSAACSPTDDNAADMGTGDGTQRAEASASATSTVSPEAVSIKKSAEQDGGTWEFAYSWPAQVSAIPELAEELKTERERIENEDRAEWEKSLTSLADQGDCGGCRSRSYSKEWKVVANLPDWLSLSADFSNYTGGAHGMYGMQSLVWDKTAKSAMETMDLFGNPSALQNAISEQLCAKLDAERAKRRGSEVERNSGDYFNDCPGLDEATLLVGSSNGKTFDRMTVYFGPYVAGAYAEGDYQIDLGVTPAVIDAVKPAYQDAFTVKR